MEFKPSEPGSPDFNPRDDALETELGTNYSTPEVGKIMSEMFRLRDEINQLINSPSGDSPEDKKKRTAAISDLYRQQEELNFQLMHTRFPESTSPLRKFTPEAIVSMTGQLARIREEIKGREAILKAIQENIDHPTEQWKRSPAWREDSFNTQMRLRYLELPSLYEQRDKYEELLNRGY